MISSGMGNDVSSLVLRVRNILEEGIEVGNFHYQFLTSTSSQLRDHTCWFVRSSEDGSTDRAQSIRDWMGDFSGICTMYYSKHQLFPLLKEGASIS